MAVLDCYRLFIVHAAGNRLGGSCDRSEMLGWYDAEKRYLLPEAAYDCQARYFKAQGNVFLVCEITLRKLLSVSGIIETDPGRSTMITWLDGSCRRMIISIKTLTIKSLKTN